MTGAVAGYAAGGNAFAAASAADAARVEVENNTLGDGFRLPKGMTDYGLAVASWSRYAEENGLSPEEKQAGLSRLARGEMPEGADIAKAIVDIYKDSVLIAAAAYLGPAASVGKVVAGGFIGLGANSGYQWYDLNQPGNENQSWDYLGSAASFATGMLAPGRGIMANTGIAMGGTFFTEGPDIGSLTGAAAGSLAGGAFGKYAPFPGEVNDIVGGIWGEVIRNKIKDIFNEDSKK